MLVRLCGVAWTVTPLMRHRRFDEPASAALELLGLPLEHDKDEEGGPWTVTTREGWDDTAGLPAEATRKSGKTGKSGKPFENQ